MFYALAGYATARIDIGLIQTEATMVYEIFRKGLGLALSVYDEVALKPELDARDKAATIH